MPTSYSESLRISLPGDNELSGLWGQVANVNYRLLETAICGYTQISVTSANVTLTTVDGATDQARNMVLDLVGASTGARQVIVPAVEKIYLVINSTTGGFSHTVKTSSGTGVAVAPGGKVWLICDGTNVFSGSADTSSFYPTSGGSVTGPVLLVNGTLSNPAIAFTGDVDTGIKWDSSGTYSVVCNGVSVGTFGPSSVTITQGTTLQQSLAVGGIATFNNTAGFNNSMTLGANSSHSIVVNGTPTFNAATAFGSTVTVTGAATLNGNVTTGNASVVRRASAGAFISHASSSNLSGTITVSTSAPSGGSNGDIWFQV